MSDFKWVQAFAVKVENVEGFDPAAIRPVLAVCESASMGDPWRVGLVLIVPDDAGRLKRVSVDNCELGGVGSWSQLQLLQQRQMAPGLITPDLKLPPDLRRV